MSFLLHDDLPLSVVVDTGASDSALLLTLCALQITILLLLLLLSTKFGSALREFIHCVRF